MAVALRRHPTCELFYPARDAPELPGQVAGTKRTGEEPTAAAGTKHASPIRLRAIGALWLPWQAGS